MRQRLEIIVTTSVDVDEWIPAQEAMEKALKNMVGGAVQRMTDDPDTDVELEYGEPV